MPDKPATGLHSDSPPHIAAQVAAEGFPGNEIMPQFVNRFVVAVDPIHTRVVFGDAAVGINATYHTSVVMSTSDALALANLIVELNKKPDPRSVDTSGSSRPIAMGISDEYKKPR